MEIDFINIFGWIMKRGRPKGKETFKVNFQIEKENFMRFRRKAGNYQMSKVINQLIHEYNNR